MILPEWGYSSPLESSRRTLISPSGTPFHNPDTTARRRLLYWEAGWLKRT